ncbi:hypothetical protein FB567DRAFT_251101 [Paraphoma chrysanthemicola]|uniref:Uncharacterized protein n=1 Tax=Paraphoma chrysanthemicola TaxID=798071 RepID=A0A8K0VSB1_9PLEO|nr:hypothetical protein FB567DRAFT_251101 [Paraphoma chrysanthemicola]
MHWTWIALLAALHSSLPHVKNFVMHLSSGSRLLRSCLARLRNQQSHLPSSQHQSNHSSHPSPKPSSLPAESPQSPEHIVLITIPGLSASGIRSHRPLSDNLTNGRVAGVSSAQVISAVDAHGLPAGFYACAASNGYIATCVYLQNCRWTRGETGCANADDLFGRLGEPVSPGR